MKLYRVEMRMADGRRRLYWVESETMAEAMNKIEGMATEAEARNIEETAYLGEKIAEGIYKA